MRCASASARRPSAPLTRGARRVAHGVDEVLELELQRLGVARPPAYRRRWPRRWRRPRPGRARLPSWRSRCRCRRAAGRSAPCGRVSRLMRLAVRLAMQPDANVSRTLAMSMRGDQHRHADRLDRRHLGCRSPRAARRGRGSSGRRRRRCRGCARGSCRAGAPRRSPAPSTCGRAAIDRRVEALGVADREHRAVPRRQRDQRVGLRERARHRLLDQHRHAARRGTARDARRAARSARRRRRRRPRGSADGVGEGRSCRAPRRPRRRGPRRDRRRRPASTPGIAARMRAWCLPRWPTPTTATRSGRRRRSRRHLRARRGLALRGRRWRCRPRRPPRRSPPGRRSAASCRRRPTARWRRRRASPQSSARRPPARRSACPASAWPP